MGKGVALTPGGVPDSGSPEKGESSDERPLQKHTLEHHLGRVGAGRGTNTLELHSLPYSKAHIGH